MLQWGLNLLVALTFLPLSRSILGLSGTYWMFSAIGTIGFVLLFFFAPGNQVLNPVHTSNKSENTFESCFDFVAIHGKLILFVVFSILFILNKQPHFG